jgi:diadenosine tetraphosphate (Ap4A) HIT family hydrolase
MSADCIFCLPSEALGVVQVWEDDRWRLLADLGAEVPGFSLLVPRRHIAYVTELDGDEARSFGTALARTAEVLRSEASAELVYVYIFGSGVPHLHVHLAPHRAGDALNEQMIRGEIVVEQLPGGAGRQVSKDFPALPKHELRQVAERVATKLAGFTSSH